MPPARAATVRIFAPEFLGQVELFSNFCSETYKFNARQQRALAGVRQHFDKAGIFQSLAEKLRPTLAVDRAQISEHGFTPAENSRQLATVIEAAIMEVYSAVDCTAKVLRAIYGPSTRGFRDSTRFLFHSFDSITGDFPDAIKDILRNAGWYEDLRFLRDELTHLGTGSCYLADDTEAVSYMHFGIKTEGKPLIVDDVFKWLLTLIAVVNDFLGRIFLFLRSSLKSTPVMQICGVVEGRMLMRYLDPTQEVTFASGQCQLAMVRAS